MLKRPTLDSETNEDTDAIRIDGFEVYEEGHAARVLKAQRLLKVVLGKLSKAAENGPVSGELIEECIDRIDIEVPYLYEPITQDWPLSLTVHWSSEVTGTPILVATVFDRCHFFDLRDIPNDMILNGGDLSHYFLGLAQNLEGMASDCRKQINGSTEALVHVDLPDDHREMPFTPDTKTSIPLDDLSLGLAYLTRSLRENGHVNFAEVSDQAHQIIRREYLMSRNIEKQDSVSTLQDAMENQAYRRFDTETLTKLADLHDALGAKYRKMASGKGAAE